MCRSFTVMAAVLIAAAAAHAETPVEQAGALAAACVTARTSADLEAAATRVGAPVAEEVIGRTLPLNRGTAAAQGTAGETSAARPGPEHRVLRAWRSTDGAVLLIYVETPAPTDMGPQYGHADRIMRYCELQGHVADAGAWAQAVLPVMPVSAVLGPQGPRQVSAFTFTLPLRFFGPSLRMNFGAPLTPSMTRDRESFVSAVRGWQAEVYLLNDRLEAADTR